MLSAGRNKKGFLIGLPKSGSTEFVFAECHDAGDKG